MARNATPIGLQLSFVLCVLSGCAEPTLYVEALRVSPHFDRVDADADGGAIGLEAGERTSAFMEVRWTEDSTADLQLTDLNFGGRWRPLELGRLSFGFQADFGLANAELEGLRNSNSLVSVGAATLAECDIVDAVAVFALFGVRQYWDTTKPTTCSDGWQSGSTGQGTCSHHGGIHHYNDMIGDGFGVEFAVGLRIRF